MPKNVRNILGPAMANFKLVICMQMNASYIWFGIFEINWFRVTVYVNMNWLPMDFLLMKWSVEQVRQNHRKHETAKKYGFKCHNKCNPMFRFVKFNTDSWKSTFYLQHQNAPRVYSLKYYSELALISATRTQSEIRWINCIVWSHKTDLYAFAYHIHLISTKKTISSLRQSTIREIRYEHQTMPHHFRCLCLFYFFLEIFM